jgi:GTP-binding protein HflX
VSDRLRALARIVELAVPYDRGDVVAALHRHGEVLSEEHEAELTRLRVRLDAADMARFADFRTG